MAALSFALGVAAQVQPAREPSETPHRHGSTLALAGQRLFEPPPKITFAPMRPLGETLDADRWEETFPSAIATSYPSNNTLRLRITIPKDAIGAVPVVVLLHYWGATDTRIEDDIAMHLSRAGIATVEMPLPYHLGRTPPGHVSGDLAIVADVDSIQGTMRQSMSDVMRTLDFIDSRSEFNKKQVGIAGTSLGAIVSAACFGAEPRIHSGAFMFGGGDLAGILWSSVKTQAIKARLIHQGYSLSRVREELRPVDPLTFNSPLDKRHSFVISARFDTVVPPPSTEALVARLGNAQRLVVDTGHYGGFLVEAKLGEALARFFASDFNGLPSYIPVSVDAPTVRLGMLADFDRGFQVAAGLDIWRANRARDGFASILLSPKGVSLFMGLDVGSGLALGASLAPRKASLGAFWSVVF